MTKKGLYTLAFFGLLAGCIVVFVKFSTSPELQQSPPSSQAQLLVPTTSEQVSKEADNTKVSLPAKLINPASAKDSSSNNSDSSAPAYTDVFRGSVLKQVGDRYMAGQQAIQVEVAVEPDSSFTDHKGNASGNVVVSALLNSNSGQTLKSALQHGGIVIAFYTVYDSRNNWYVLTRYGVSFN